MVLWLSVWNKELLTLRNFFVATKKFLKAKFDCIVYIPNRHGGICLQIDSLGEKWFFSKIIGQVLTKMESKTSRFKDIGTFELYSIIENKKYDSILLFSPLSTYIFAGAPKCATSSLQFLWVSTLILFYKQHMIKKTSWTLLDFEQSLLIFVV